VVQQPANQRSHDTDIKTHRMPTNDRREIRDKLTDVYYEYLAQNESNPNGLLTATETKARKESPSFVDHNRIRTSIAGRLDLSKCT
jgi:recombination DNA repair RAD52 pathway protein